MTRLIHHLRSNAIAYLALIVALGGTSYAAVNLPAGSVGARQLKSGSVTTDKLANGSVTQKKLDPKSIGGSVLHWAIVDSTARVIGGSRGARSSPRRRRPIPESRGAPQFSSTVRGPGAPRQVSLPTPRSRTPSERRIVQASNGRTTFGLWVFTVLTPARPSPPPINVAVIC